MLGLVEDFHRPVSRRKDSDRTANVPVALPTRYVCTLSASTRQVKPSLILFGIKMTAASDGFAPYIRRFYPITVAG